MNINIIRNKLYKKCLNKLRFYKRELPYIGEMVSSEIMDYNEIGINVFLKEYKKDAFMSYNESSSSRRIKTIKRQFSKNKLNILNVQDVDYIKGFIDVSKRNVNEKDQDNYIKLIDKYELIFKILVKIFIWNRNPTCIEEVTQFLEKTLWLIEPINIREILAEYDTNKDIFKTKFNLDNDFNKLFVENLEKALPPKKYEISIKYQINSYSIDAIEVIKEHINNLVTKTAIPIEFQSGAYYLSKIILETKTEEEIKTCLNSNIAHIKSNIPDISEDISIKLLDSSYRLI